MQNFRYKFDALAANVEKK